MNFNEKNIIIVNIKIKNILNIKLKIILIKINHLKFQQNLLFLKIIHKMLKIYY